MMHSMNVLGIVLAVVLLMSLFAISAEAIPKNQIKKDIRDIAYPTDSKSVKVTKISKPRTLHIWYVAEIQVCAGLEKLYSPDLELHSDKGVTRVKLWGLIMPNSCKTGEFFVSATDPDSISATFASQVKLESPK